MEHSQTAHSVCSCAVILLLPQPGILLGVVHESDAKYCCEPVYAGHAACANLVYDLLLSSGMGVRSHNKRHAEPAPHLVT
jgi:hypothetical protein